MADWLQRQGKCNVYLKESVTWVRRKGGCVMNGEEESKLVDVYGDNVAKAQAHPRVAYQRMISTRRVKFVCTICRKTVTQLRYPGRNPSYCSETCEDEGRRKKTQERVKKLRTRQKMTQEQKTACISPEEM